MISRFISIVFIFKNYYKVDKLFNNKLYIWESYEKQIEIFLFY